MSAARDGRWRWAMWLVLGAVALASLVVAAAGDGGARTPEDRARSVESSIRCPTCRGQSVLESQAPAAKGIRAEIARRIGAGETDDQIRAYLVSVHGESILLTPPRSGVAGLVWVLPIAALVVALGGVALTFRRWRADGTRAPSAADEALVRAALQRGSL